jgi:hypothetical protein
MRRLSGAAVCGQDRLNTSARLAAGRVGFVHEGLNRCQPGAVLPAALSEDRTAAFDDDGSAALVGDRLRGSPSAQRLLTANRH